MATESTKAKRWKNRDTFTTGAAFEGNRATHSIDAMIAKTEIRGQRSEVRGQRSEIRGQGSEIRQSISRSHPPRRIRPGAPGLLAVRLLLAEVVVHIDDRSEEHTSELQSL